MATAVMMPRQGQSVESCVLVEWLVKVGDSVVTGKPLANIETDKAVFEVESPADGTVLELFFPAGSDVPVLTNIAAIGAAGEDVSALRPGTAAAASAPAAAAAGAPAKEAPAAVVAAPAASADGAGISPRARKAAEHTGVRAETLAGSGPGGRVIERDVRAAAAAQPRMSPGAREAAAKGGSIPSAGSGPGGMVLAADIGRGGAPASTVPPAAPETVPVTGIRKIIAERMRGSLGTTAQLTMCRSFDATAILDLRAQIKSGGKAAGLPDITINDMLAYALVRTLVKHKALNAHFLGDKIVRYGQVNLGVAMDTPRGLMVPVLHDAQALSLSGISQRIKPMAEAAQKGSVNPDLLTGGTFTLTNLGMMGIEQFTPVLNAPEVAILGVGGIQLKPVERDGRIEHVKSITLSLTIDHQAVDGAPAARFLQDLATALEQFGLLLLA